MLSGSLFYSIVPNILLVVSVFTSKEKYVVDLYKFFPHKKYIAKS